MNQILILSFLIFSYCNGFSQTKNTDNPYIKRFYYKDKIVSQEKFYGEDKKIDSLKTYYNTGELDEVFHYDKGKFHGLCFKYDKNGKKLTSWQFEQGNLIKRTDLKIKFNKKTKEKIISFHNQLKELNTKLKENPKNFKYAYNRASIRNYLGNRILALDDFKKFERYILKNLKTSNFPEKLVGGIYDHIGGIYDNYEMENRAIHYKFKALNASPKESRLYHNLGSYLVKIKAYRPGIFYLKKANEMVPNHSFANWIMSVAYTDLGEYKKALKCINIAIKNEKSIHNRGSGNDERDLWTTRGFLLHKLGDTEKGIVDLEEALDINKNNSYAYKNLGIIYQDLGDYNRSCELLQRAKELGYEKNHDIFDLDFYLKFSCENTVTKNKAINGKEKSFLYPNPSKNNVVIQNFENEKYKYNIFSLKGKLLYSNQTKNNTIEVSSLPKGLFKVKVETEEGTSKTFILIKE